MSNKDLTIHMKIKTLRVEVSERLPVIVIWSRQSKQIKTKKRLLSDQAPTTVFDEEFQITTTMPCDEDGKPTKKKMSQLTIASDKARGILGKADLDLAQFSYDDYNVIRCPIAECAYEGAWIEVALKATVASRSSNRNGNLNESYRSTTTVGNGDTVMTQAHYTELLDQFQEKKKAKRVAESEKAKEIQQLQQRNNHLQTDFENAKVGIATAQKKAKEAVDLVLAVEEQIQEQHVILADKTVQFEQSCEDVKAKDAKIEELKGAIVVKEQELVQAGEQLKDAEAVTAKTQLDVNFFYDIQRYDTNFMGDILTLLKPKNTISRENTGQSRRGSEKTRRAPAKAK